MNDNLGFPQAHGASPRCTSAAWRDCSISFGGICRRPIADKIRTRLRVWAELRWPWKRGGSGSPRLRPPRRLLWGQGARTACRLRQSRAPGGGGDGSRAHATRSTVSRAPGVHATESDRAHIARPRNLSSPAGSRSRADRRSGMDASAARGRAGSVAMTAGELLDAAHSLPFRFVRDALSRPAVCCRRAPSRRWSFACGAPIADVVGQELTKGRHCQRRRRLASEQ